MKSGYFLPGLLVWLTLGCQSPPDPELTQASAALSQMAVNRTLKQSCYSVIYPDGGQASDFVDYLFSDLGAAEWPVALDEIEAEQLAAIGQPTLPSNVTVSPSTRKQPGNKEIVLIADNANRVILVEGYAAGTTEVVFNAQWPLGEAQASEATQHLCQSTLEMGISPYAQPE